MTSPSIMAEIADYREEERHKDPHSWFARRFTLFFQLMFRDMPPGCYHWSPKETETEITITDQVPCNLEAIEQRPSLQLVTAAVQNQNLYLDNLESLDLRTGERTHSDLLSGQMSINVHAKNDDVARRLAFTVRNHVQRYRRYLMQIAKLHLIGHVVSMGPSSPPGALVNAVSSIESTMVAVMMPFFFADRWVAKEMMLPFGKSDPDARGIAAKPGASLEEKPTAREWKISARLLKPGVTWRREDGFKQFRSAPLSPPTLRGRQMTILRRLDELEDQEQLVSPYVQNEIEIKDE